MNIKRISIIHISLTIILSVCFFLIFDYKVLLGILLGSSVGYFNLYSLNKKINELTDEEIPNIRKVIKGNRKFRYLILMVVLIIAGLLPQVFNIIATCFSVLINKISIYIDLFINKKKERRKDNVTSIRKF